MGFGAQHGVADAPLPSATGLALASRSVRPTLKALIFRDPGQPRTDPAAHESTNASWDFGWELA